MIPSLSLEKEKEKETKKADTMMSCIGSKSQKHIIVYINNQNNTF